LKQAEILEKVKDDGVIQLLSHIIRQDFIGHEKLKQLFVIWI
jgi:hypothetical protein